MPKCRYCGTLIEAEDDDPTFDHANESLVVRGKLVHLTPMEWSLLEALRARMNRTPSREFLMDCLYGQGDGARGNILDVLVCRLRQKLNGTRYRIVTRHRLGFRLEKIAQPPKIAIKSAGKRGHRKLNEDLVRRIRSDRRPQTVIAAELGISQASVSLVRRGLVWRHVR
jgi:DNA-binding winged helix-turn-helix (wHTH) protein